MRLAPAGKVLEGGKHVAREKQRHREKPWQSPLSECKLVLARLHPEDREEVSEETPFAEPELRAAKVEQLLYNERKAHLVL